MGFFKEIKQDFSQAVDELMPEEKKQEVPTDDDMEVNTLDTDVDMESELSKLNGLLEQVSAETENQSLVKARQVEALEQEFDREIRHQERKSFMEDRNSMYNQNQAGASLYSTDSKISDETTVITEGTSITGDLMSNGSMDIKGRIKGNITCSGKLVVTGVLEGNSNSSEFFADSAKIEGEVNSSGTVKIGVGSVVIGNITASSAVIAGAIKGDIDVQGPVVVDTSAVVMGNIKSRSVQINNGAVIEGYCSQVYADIDVKSLFDEKKGME